MRKPRYEGVTIPSLFLAKKHMTRNVVQIIKLITVSFSLLFFFQRHKYIQPDTLMKNLHRPIPKSKILEELKKTNESHANQSVAATAVAATTTAKTTTSSSSQSLISQSIISCSPNISQSTLTQRKAATATTGGASIKSKLVSSQSRKSMSKKVDEKPTNTIRSMFAKQLEKSQLEKSQLEKSQINGAIDQITTLNLSDGIGTSGKQSDGPIDESTTTNDNGKNHSIIEPSQEILVSGSLHKRLTRRNSMTLRTPTKSVTTTTQSDDIVPATPSSIKKRRCTMFTPSLKLSIEEENGSSGDDTTTTTRKTTSSSSSSFSTASTLTPANKTVLTNADKTLNKSIAMDVCNRSKPRNTSPSPSTVTQCNSKVRQLLNDDLSKSSNASSSSSGIDGSKFLQPKIRLPLQTRRTTFTVQPMDETKVLQINSSSSSNFSTSNSSTSTPVSLTKRRNTMNINARSATPQSTVVAELNKSNSCDAILTPTNNKINGKSSIPFPIPPDLNSIQLQKFQFQFSHFRRHEPCTVIHTIISIVIESAP